MARSTRERVSALVYPESLMTRETVIVETPARRATSLIVLIGPSWAWRAVDRELAGRRPSYGPPVRRRGSRFLVQDGLDLRVVDVGLVVPVEPGVDRLRQGFAADR